jgi:hypothetical protein
MSTIDASLTAGASGAASADDVTGTHGESVDRRGQLITRLVDVPLDGVGIAVRHFLPPSP